MFTPQVLQPAVMPPTWNPTKKPRNCAFRGPMSFCSSFHNCRVEYEGIIYPSAEHAFQAAKTTDVAIRSYIATLPSAVEAKKYGKALQARPDWDTYRLVAMKEIVSAKFTQNKELATKLTQTGSKELIEENDWYDTFWGVCNGKGENHLGKILMEVRSEIMGQTTDQEFLI